MESLEALTRDGIRTQIAADLLETFKSSLRGKVILEGDDDYESSRKVWNGMIDRKPALIVQCKGTSDVIRSVKFAAVHQLLVSVKGGGHNFGGLAVCDKGMMIDLSQMRSVRTDLSTMTVRAEAGALLSDLDRETQFFGFATPSGTVSHTGIAGLTLGGGQGWMMNKYGLTCDNLVSADVVTANGDLLLANKDCNTDLFWAIRGGGGNFGIVTSFEYKMHPVGPMIYGGLVLYPLSQAADVFKFYRDFSVNTPPELTVMSAVLCLPDGTSVSAMAAGWIGEREEGIRVLEPLMNFGTPISNMIGDIPYLTLQSIFDASVAHGMRRYAKMGYVREISDDLIDCMIDAWNRRTSAHSILLFNSMKAAVSQVAPDETAFFQRHVQWHYDIIAQWYNSDEDDKHMAWARELWKNTNSFTQGASINFFNSDDGADRVKMSYGTNYERLVSIKQKYDPENFFRFNANIQPMLESPASSQEHQDSPATV